MLKVEKRGLIHNFKMLNKSLTRIIYGDIYKNIDIDSPDKAKPSVRRGQKAADLKA
jgi:hypothetical protein